MIPALAFGEQLSLATDGSFNGTHAIAVTGLMGLLQSLVGGQPLLIVGLAEPTVIVYSFMYDFAKSNGFTERYVPWCSWVLIWAALFLVTMALAETCKYIEWFTAFAVEVFGMLIATLFAQTAIEGLIDEFGKDAPCHGQGVPGPPSAVDAAGGGVCMLSEAPASVANGLWALVVLAAAFSSMVLLHYAQSWVVFVRPLRSFFAGFGVPLMVLVWSAASYVAPSYARGSKLTIPDIWSSSRRWRPAPFAASTGAEVGYAAVPGAIIALLFYFDHNVSSRAAQQPAFKVVRPPAYSWDLLVLGGMTLLCGVLGLPPVNGVIPQAPMHTRSLERLQQSITAAAQAPRGKSAIELTRPPSPPVAPESAAYPPPPPASPPGTPCLHRRTPRGRLGVPGSSPAPHGVADRSHAGADAQRCADAAEARPGWHNCDARGSGECGSADPTSPGERPAADGRGGCRAEGSHRLEHVAAASVGAPGAPPEDVRLGPSAGAGGPELGGSGGRPDECVRPPADASLDADVKVQADLLGTGCCVEAEYETRDSTSWSPDPSASMASTKPEVVVREQRLTNLLQSLLLCASLLAAPAFRLMPRSVIYAYFLFLAYESLPSNSFFRRICLLLVDPELREARVANYGCDFKVVMAFTLIQLAFLAAVYGITWAGIAGIAFPVIIVALIPVRRYVLPRFFAADSLQKLDPISMDAAQQAPEHMLFATAPQTV